MYFFKLAAIIGLLALSSQSWAGCSSSDSTDRYSRSLPVTTLSVSRDRALGPIGSVISIADANTATRPYVICNTRTYAMLRFASTMEASDYSPDVYKTNVPGIGVKIWDDYSGTLTLSNDLQQWYVVSSGAWSNWLRILGIKLQFYVIGPVTQGTIQLNVPTVEEWANTVLGTTSGGFLVNVLSITGSIPVQIKACETPDITVDLDKHDSGEFSGVHSKSAPTPFNFEIKNCDPGMNSVNYTFAPATGVTLEQSGTANQYLTLDSSSDASGVGIQVLYENGDLVPFNSKIKYTGYNTSTSGSYVIPMKARYIQTESIIHGGKANSALEFTMSYE